MATEPRILVSWNVVPQIAKPFTLCEGQVTVGPAAPGGAVPAGFAAATPNGKYDLLDVIRKAGIDPAFDVVFIKSDAAGGNMPTNLAAFDSVKILASGATHMLEAPLRKMVGYALEEGFDAVVGTCDRHHLHWFKNVGIQNCIWLPSLFVQHLERPWRAVRAPQMAFIGQVGKLHPERQRLLELLGREGIPAVSRMAPREAMAEAFATSVLSFNASLNADLNYRVFEVMSAGGCLLTDRLSSETGLDLLFEEDKELVAYGSDQELVEKARWYLDHPAAALAVAKAGTARFLEEYLPEKQQALLLRWIAGETIEGRFNPDADRRSAHVETDFARLRERLETYEIVQELHRVNSRLKVMVAADVDPVVVDDLRDLPRIELHHVGPLPRPIEGVQEVEPTEAYGTEWDLVIQTYAPEETPPRLRGRGRIDLEQLLLTAATLEPQRRAAAGVG